MTNWKPKPADERAAARADAEKALRGDPRDLAVALHACSGHVQAEIRRAERDWPDHPAVPSVLREPVSQACAGLIAAADALDSLLARLEREQLEREDGDLE